VESAAEGQNLELVGVALGARIATGELERALVGLGPAVAEVHFVGKGACAQHLRQLGMGGGVVEIARVPHAAGRRLCQRVVNARIVVAQCIDGNARHTVQVPLAGCVIEGATVAPLQHKGRAPIDAQDILLLQVHHTLCVHPSLQVFLRNH